MIGVESIFNKFLKKGRKKEKIKERKKIKIRIVLIVMFDNEWYNNLTSIYLLACNIKLVKYIKLKDIIKAKVIYNLE